MADEFRSMAVAMRQKKQAEQDERAAAEAARSSALNQIHDDKISALRTAVLPVLERAKQEFASEDIPSEIQEHFDSDDGPHVSFRCKGPKSIHVPTHTTRLPVSRMLFFYVGDSGRIEAKISNGYASGRLRDAAGVGDHPPNDPDLNKWVQGLIERILGSYFDNPNGTLA
jgi:hypothetical protein